MSMSKNPTKNVTNSFANSLPKTLAKALTLPRGMILSLSGLALAYALMAPGAAPALGQFDCAAPHYFETTTGAPDAAHEAGMSALRQQAGQALTLLRGRIGGS